MKSRGPERPNPFPGLRPFRSDEHHLFFGREEQIAALLQLLRKNRFLAVVGTSGSGKSSLVRAGMIAELHGGTMTHAGSAWEVIVLRPGGSPIENLAKAMVEADLYDAEDSSTLARLKATLSRSRFGLVEAMKQSEVFEPGTNLLVVVDQFEELFRFRQQGVDSEEAAAAFVNLLLTASEQGECPIYVAITMRSDYLGDCSEIPGLAEAVNEGEYLIPRLMRDQKRDAIEKPIGVGGAKISPLLVQRLLNDVGDDPDQLPVLQHALMRMWDVWAAGNDHGRPIGVSDFEATGGLATALSNHADELFDSLPDQRHRSACEKIFKTLTEKGDDNRGIRRPTRLAALQAIAGVDRETATAVLDAFRQSGVTFLMPGLETEFEDRTVVDLSHESLMRGWQRLRGWVDEEAQSARIFRRLLDTARLWSDGKAGLFRDPDLQIALSWRDEEHPNAEWAEQYGGQFETAISFLKSSEQAVQAELQVKEDAQRHELEQAQQLAEARKQRLEQQQRAARKLRTMLAGLAAVAVVAVVACFAALSANNKATALAEIAGLEATKAKRSAAEANSEREAVKLEQQKTHTALTEVELQKEQVEGEKTRAEGLLQKSILAEKAALDAEQRSREFRYATDMQLAATLVADSTANAGQVLTRLSDHDPGENANLAGKVDLRGFEWHYLKQLAGGRASVIKGFDKDIVDTALSPSGELVTLTSDSRLQRWNVATGHEVRPALDLKKGRIIGAQALSRDGRLAAMAVGNQVFLVDAVTGQEQPRTLPTQARGVLIFSPDGHMVITVDTNVGWWDAATGKPLAVQDFKLIAYSTADYRTPVSVSADGLTLAVGGQGAYRGAFSVFRLNPQTREISTLANNAGDTGTKRTLAISPDGQTVAVSLFFQGALALYDAATGKLLHRESSAHSASISAIAFRADGTELATASLDGTIKVWKDFKTLDVAKATSLMGHSDQVVALAYSPGDQRLMSAGQDKSVRLWDLEQNTASLHRVIVGSGGQRARYSPDGTLMAIAGELQLHLRDGTTGQVLLQLPRRSDGLSADSVAFSPDGRLLAAGYGGKADVSLIELWDIDRRERIAELPGTTAIPGFITTEYTGIVGTLAFKPDGRQLVAGFGSLSLLSWGDRGKVPLLVYDIATKRVVRRLEGHGNTCVSVTFSPDGSRMASASMDCTARIWDVATWQELHVLHNPDPATDLGQRRVYDVAFSPDGKLLAMASAEGHVIIWDAETGEYRQSLHGHANEVWAVAFSPNGLTLASGSIDNTVRLWNVATWRELVRLDPKIPMDSRSLAFSPDGHRLLGAGFRGGAVVWSVQPTGEPSGPKSDQVSQWLRTGTDFQTRVRMHSESLRLFEPLEQLAQQSPDNGVVEEALAATRANWHASRQEWKPAVEQFDRLRQLGVKTPDAWLRTPGLLRLATALLYEHRPVDAAALLTGGEKRRADDGGDTRVVAFGFEYTPGQYPLKLSRIYRGSPAWKAGLRAGDRLLKFNDLELTAKTFSDYLKAGSGGEGTKLVVTIQHLDQEQPETVELTKTNHIWDDVTVEQLEALFATVDQQLTESPNHPELLELRAELAGQASESDRQVADFTAAIAALESQEPQPTADLQRLHRRRGDAYVRLKQWPLALDDYARGITAETTDDDLLANQALAQAEAIAASHREAIDAVWFDDAPPAGASLQGDTPWEIVGRPDHPVYSGKKSFRRQAKGQSQHFFTDAKPGLKFVKGGVLFAYVYLDPQDPPQAVMLQFHDGGGWEHRAYWGEDLIGYGTPDTAAHVSMGPLPKTGEWVRLEVPVEQVGLKPGAELSGWAFTQFAGICYWDRAGTTGSWGGTFETPWHKLAAAYRLMDDQPAIDQLVERQLSAAGPIGDLFAQGDNKDWQRAVDVYSRAITPDTTDADLLTKRARAYEELKDWPAAATDWTRAAGESPERVTFLTEFAGRLEKSDQRALADAQRQRARQVLEATLQADPDDAPAADRLAQILLDLSEPKPPEWTAVNPAASTAGGATLAVQDDGSMVFDHGLDMVTLPAFGRSVSAIRLESSPDASPQADGAAAFTEYRLQAIDVPTSKSGAPLGRYVRIDLPGDSQQFPRRLLALNMTQRVKALSLAEVQVFQGDDNVALTGTARQSSDHDSPTAGKAVAARAVDGKTDGIYTNRSVTHTQQLLNHDPWWEVDLGDERAIDRIVVWNRTDRLGNENPAERLHHFRVQILDRSHRVIFEQMIDDAPNPSREIDCRSWLVAKTPEPDGDKPQWTLRLGRASVRQRIRLATADRLPAREFDHDSSALAWTVAQPTELKSSGGRTFTALDDGSYLVETIATDTLPLPVLPETVRTVRIETASMNGVTPNDAPVFSEYRAQAVGAATDSGTILGRYVRLDLPGDNQQFPRKEGDGARKSLNLAELQVFRGDENIALRKPARQSSGIDTSRTTADRAVDGNTTGNDTTNSYAHTSFEKDAWWEVDLGSEQAIDRMVVWNRSDIGEMSRMNHFRVRVLDASRQVVFEQVIDAAPKPSREISCRSLLVKTMPSSDDDQPRWSLRLDKNTGVDPGGRFRISTAGAADSLAREEAIAEARRISLPGARLAAAYDLNGQPAASADWFGRALASMPTDHQRQPVLASLKAHPDSLTELLRRQPDDRQLQLAQARCLVQQGGKALSDQETGRALASLQSARELYEAWLAHTPEQHWTVLTPVEMKAEHGSRLTLQPDGSVFVQQPAAKDTYTLVVPWDLKDVRGLRLEALADARLPKGGPGWAGNGNFHLKHLSLQATSADQPRSPRTIALRNAHADFIEHGWDFRGVVTGRGKAGWGVLPEVNQNHTALFEIAEDVSDIRSTQLTIVLHFESEYDKHLLGRFRLSFTSDAATLPSTRRRFDLKDSELTALDVALGKAYAQQKYATEAVAALTRALNRTPEEKDRKPLVEQFPQEATVLTLLAQQHPQDQLLQLALAKHLAESGKKVLAENRQDEALPQLAQARELFSRLAAERPDSTWTVLQPTEMTSEGGADLALEPDGSIFVSGNNPDRDTYTISAPLAEGGFTALRLEAIPDERLPGRGAGRLENVGEFVLAEIEVALKSGAGADRALVINEGYADFSRDGYFVSQAFDSDPETQWNVLPRFTEPHFAVCTFDPPAASPAGLQNVVIRLKCGLSNYSRRNLGRFRLSVTNDANAIAVAKFHHELKSSGLADLERSLGNVHGRQARVTDAAAAFQQAFDLAPDRDARLTILQAASAHAGVLDQLAALRPADAAFLDVLARHYQQGGDIPGARVAAAKAREQYEQRLAAEPSNARLTKDLADLLLDVSPVDWATRKWTILKPTDMKSEGGATLTVLDDGSILAGGNAANNEVYTLTAKAGLPNIQAFLLEAIPHESLPFSSNGRRPSDGNFALSEFKIAQSSDGRAGSFAAVPLTLAVCDYSQSHSPVTNVLDGKDGTFWDILPHVRQPHYAVFAPAAPLTLPAEGVLTFTLEFKLGQPLALGRFRLSATDNPEALSVEQARLLAVRVENPWLRLGVAYRSVGDSDRALDAIVRAIELAGSRSAKAAAAQQAAAFDELFARLLERFPDDSALRLGQAKHLAAKHTAANQFQTAVDLLTAVIADFPDDLELRNLRAGALMKLGRWPAADADYARVIDLETDAGRRRAAERTRAEVQLRLGRFQAGAEAFLQEMWLTPDYYRTRDASVAGILAGNSGAARTAALRLYEKSSSTKDASEARWQVHVFTSLPGLVTKDNSQKLLELAKTGGDTWTEPMTAAIHYRLGDLAKAEPLLTTTRSEQEFKALGAMLLYDRGEFDKARKLLDGPTNWIKGERSKDPDSAIPIQQGWQNWVVRLAVYREATRKLIGSRIKELDELLAKEQNQTTALLERARMLADSGLHDEALCDLDRLAALKVDTVEAHALHGRVLTGLNRGEEALPHPHQAVAAGSQEAGVYAARGAILLQQGQSAEARADLERSLDLEPTELAARSLADLLLAEQDNAATWNVLRPVEKTSKGGAELTLEADGSIFVSGQDIGRDTYTLTVPLNGRAVTGIRLETLPDARLPKGGTGRNLDGGSFLLSEFKAEIQPTGLDAFRPLTIKDGFADYAYNATSPAQAFDDNDSTYWSVNLKQAESHTAIFTVDPPQVGNERESLLRIHLAFGTSAYPDRNLGRFRMSLTESPADLAREKVRLAALNVSNPWIRLAYAQLLTADSGRAATSFVNGFQHSPDATERLALLDQLLANDALATEVRQRLADDPQWHLLLGHRFAAQGDWDQADAAYRQAVALNADAVTDWIRTGFWKVEGYPYGLGTAQPPETGPDPFVSAANTGQEGSSAPLAWQPATSGTNGQFNFGFERACHYVLTRLWSPVEQDVALQLGDDDNLRLFVNDQWIFESQPNGGAARPKEHEIAATLHAGWNTVLIKLQNQSGAGSLHLALSHNPQDLIRARLGNRFYQAERLAATGRKDEAAALLQTAIEADSQDDALYAKRAQTYHKLQLWELAIADWTRADALNPKGRVDSLYLEYRSALHAQLRQFDKQAADADTLLKRVADGLHPAENASYFLVIRARAHDSRQDRDNAQADYDQAVERSTSGLRAHFLTQRANHLIKHGRWGAAADDFAAAAKDTASSTTKSWSFSRDRALIALMVGDLDGYRRSAAELLDRIGDQPSGDQANWLLWVYTAGPGLVTDANYDRLLAATAHSDQYHQDRNRAALPFRRGRFQEAAPLFAKHAGGKEYEFLAAMANARSGNPAEADRLFGQANLSIDQQERIDPSRVIPESQGWQLWSVYKCLQRETIRQLAGPRFAELEAALNSKPDDLPLLAERAVILAKIGLHERALGDLNRVFAAQGGTAELLGVRGGILARLQRPEEALADLNRAVDRGATDAMVFAERGRLRWQQGQTGPAQADLENSLQRQPSAAATSALIELLLAEAAKIVHWTVLKPVDMSTENGASLTLLEDGSILAGGENRPGESYRLVMKTDQKSIAAIRLEVLTDPSLPRLGPGRGSGGNYGINWQLSTKTSDGDDARPLRIQSAVADYSFSRAPITVSHWNIAGGEGRPHVAFLNLATPLQDEAGLQFALTIKGPAGGQYGDQNLGRFRVSIIDDPRAFAHEQSRLAVGQIADPAARLDAAYRVLGAVDRATENFHRLIDHRRNQAAAPDQLVQALRLRGAHFVRTGQWKLAAADYAESAALDPKSSSADWMTAAALWAYAADGDQHRLYCQSMAVQFRESTAANDVERTVKVSLLLAQKAVPDQATTAKFLEAVAKTKDPGSLKWFLSAKALLACRNGDFDAAIEAINESLRLLSAGGDAPGSTAGLTARSVQALIFARQGDAARARVALKELQTLLATEAKLKWEADGTLDGLTILSGERAQHDRLIPEILRREAERSLETQARMSDDQK